MNVPAKITESGPSVEAALVERLEAEDPTTVQQAIEALGHVGDVAAKAALRGYIAENPDAELRLLMAAMRALGYHLVVDIQFQPSLTGIASTLSPSTSVAVSVTGASGLPIWSFATNG